jgi:hypothetical protein
MTVIYRIKSTGDTCNEHNSQESPTTVGNTAGYAHLHCLSGQTEDLATSLAAAVCETALQVQMPRKRQNPAVEAKFLSLIWKALVQISADLAVIQLN